MQRGGSEQARAGSKRWWRKPALGAVAAITLAMPILSHAADPAGVSQPLVSSLPTPPALTGLQKFETKYYTLYTDVDPDTEREAAVRMTRMAEEYDQRTRDFAGVITHKFPFYLFRREEDYLAAGGWPGSAGLFLWSSDGDSKLMAVAGKKSSLNTWHTVQHEGFHQFAQAVIGGELPVWANEGLAEYFGEGIFTGDGFVVGVVPPWRLTRLKNEIQDNRLKPIPTIMVYSSEQWRADMSIQNYDQAWSMIHFLVHGDHGRYRGAFSEFMARVSKGENWQAAWLATLGQADRFEPRWRAYWLNQSASPTPELYAQATGQMLESFLVRASVQHQVFSSMDPFLDAARAGTLKCADADWLPPSLLRDALRLVNSDIDWSIQLRPDEPPALTGVMADGTRVVVNASVRSGRVQKMWTEIDSLPATLTAATDRWNAGDATNARQMLQQGLAQHPQSPAAAAAKRLLAAMPG